MWLGQNARKKSRAANTKYLIQRVLEGERERGRAAIGIGVFHNRECMSAGSSRVLEAVAACVYARDANKYVSETRGPHVICMAAHTVAAPVCSLYLPTHADTAHCAHV